MEIYRGRAYKQWLIDRFACGLDKETIKASFKNTFDYEITDSEMDNMLKNEEDKIKQREKELLEQLKEEASNELLELERLLKDAKPALEELKSEGNYRVYSQMMNSTLKALELIAKIKGNIKDNTEVTINQAVIQQENFEAMCELEEDGIIVIKDKKKLKKMLNIDDLR